MLNKYVGNHPKYLDLYLLLLMLAYISSTHKSTGETTSLLLLGREVEPPVDLFYGRHDTPRLPVDHYTSYIKESQSTMFEVHELARSQMLKAGARQKRKYDHNVKKY